jgi:hypothetical protein
MYSNVADISKHILQMLLLRSMLLHDLEILAFLLFIFFFFFSRRLKNIRNEIIFM